MLTVNELDADVLEVTLDGIVDKDDIRRMEAALGPMLDRDGRIAVLIRADALRDVTADAMAEDMRFEFGMLPKWAKLARLALVTDKQAFEAVTRWIAPLFPTTEMRCFARDRVEAAQEWVNGFSRDMTAPEGSGIRILEDGSDGLLAFEINGSVTKDDAARVFAPFEQLTAGGGKIDLLVRITAYSGFDPAMLVDRDFLGSKIAAISHIRRYAVVGAPGWMRAIVGAAGTVMPFEMRSFDLAEEDAARAWLRQGRDRIA